MKHYYNAIVPISHVLRIAVLSERLKKMFAPARLVFCFVLLFLILATQNSFSQVSTKYTYTPNATSAAYTALVGTNVCSGANVSGTTSNAFYQGAAANTAGSGIPIGFTFSFNCVNYTTLGIHTNAFVWFGSGVPAAATTSTIGNASANLGGSGTIDGLIACWAGSVASTPRIPIGASSAVRYTTTGTAPNRIFKVEWAGYKMTGANNGTGLIPSSQIWLYETSNNIELYFNNQSSIFINGTRSGQIGLRGTSNADFKTLNGGTTGWANIPAGTLNSQVVSTSSSPGYYPNAHRVLAFNFTGTCCTPPTVGPSSLSFSSLTTTSVTLNWTNGNGSSRVVVARQTSAVSASPVTGTDYTATANAAFGSGANLGSNNFVVYAGTGNSVNITGLTPGQTYHFAVFEASVTFCYTTGAVANQLIPLCFPPNTAASSVSFTNVNTTTMDVNWVRGDGDAGVIVVGRLTSTAAVQPVAGTTYTTTTFGSGSGSQITGTGNYVLYIGTGTSVSVSNLIPSTSYTFSVYEYNASGICYGGAVAAAQVSASCSPSVDATAPVYSNVLGTSLTLNFTRGTGSHVLVVARATATANVAPTYNNTYAANTAFGSGATTGTGNFVVYNGTGNSVSVTGLSQFTAYTFVIYEYNASPNCYSISPLSTAITTLNTTASGLAVSCAYTGSSQSLALSTITATAGRVLVATGSAIDDGVYPNQDIQTMTNGSGFLFSFLGNDYSSIGISANGFIWFGTGQPGATYALYGGTPIGSASANLGGSGTINGIIAAAGADLISHYHLSAAPTPSQINVVVTGTAPNRIVTIEWTGFQNKSLGSNSTCWFVGFSDDSRLDFQIRLYEKGGTNSNRIEMLYRNQSPFCVADPFSFQIGLRGASNTDFATRANSGNLTASSTTNGAAATTALSFSSTFIAANAGVRYQPNLSVPTISGSLSNTCPVIGTTLTSSSASNNQWFLNGSVIPGPGSNTQNYVATQSGNYTVTVNASGCYSQSAPSVVTIVPCDVNLTSSAGANGTISPLGVTPVPYNTNQAYNIIPDCGYAVSDVLVDGVSQGPITTYTFNNVTVVHTISVTFAVANETCGNSIDDDCDGQTDEGCNPNFNGDTPGTSLNVIYSVNVSYPNCYPINGDLTGAGDSPESVSFTGPDQWYTFIAQSTGITITMNSNTMDNAIGLYTKSGNVYNLFDSENINPAGVGGFERLSNNTLTPGIQYYVSCGAAVGPTGGPFNVCIQHLMPSGCSYTIPAGGFPLCSNFKSVYRGAAGNGVTYNFSFTGVGGGASGTTSITGTNGLIPLSSPSLALMYGGIYDVVVDAVYALQNGAGVVETFTVLGSSASANCDNVPISAQPLVEVKSTQRCPATLLRSNYLIGSPVPGGTNACSAISYTYEFTAVSACGGSLNGLPVTYTTGSSTPYLPLGNLPYLANTGAWRVRIRPNFVYGPGVYGPAQDVIVNNTAASTMLPDDEMADHGEKNFTIDPIAAIYPNPNQGDLINLNISGVASDEVYVRVVNQMGQLVYTNRFIVDGSLNTILEFESPLASGIYTVEFICDGKRNSERMIVQH